MNSKELLEKRAELLPELKRLADLNVDTTHKWSEKDEGDWKAFNAKFDGFSLALDALRGRPSPLTPRRKDDSYSNKLARIAAIEAQFEQPYDGFIDPSILNQGKSNGGGDAGEDLEESRALGPKESCAGYVKRRLAEAGRYDANDPAQKPPRLGDLMRAMALGPRTLGEKRALAEGSDSTGGITVPDITSSAFIDRMRARTQVMVAGARTVPLTSDKTTLAKLISDPLVAWRAENAAVAESDPTFGSVVFVPKSLAVLFKASRELLEDSINVQEIVENALARAFAVELDRVALYGTGATNQPLGIRTAANVNEVSQGANGLALSNYDPILTLIQLMAEDNSGPPTALIMAPRTFFALAKFKDTTSQPLDRPDPLLPVPFLVTTGVPITETQGTSSNASTIFTGNFAELMFGIRTALRIEILRERYADVLQYGFLAWLRADVQLAHAESFGRLVGIIP